ncbi:MAG: phosphatase PAP2 family protein [Oscillospiraceae bacterium]|nr:phosphatase PAP2 family protein [Oscillospiraceae bacterium]
MTAGQYARLSAPFRPPRRARALRAVNRGLTLACYLLYPLLLVLLLLRGEPEGLLRAVLVPGSGFVLLSLVRRGLNFPRPYEALDITPLIPKDTRGRSMPSRHVFSIFVIAMAWLWACPPVGLVLLGCGVLLAAIRVIGGVHFPADVLVGAAAALLWGWAGFWLIH